ncbi:MAG: 4-hydroxy-tetrahydrodipicolinate reductase [Ilumatobacteraceae bacterium]|jgi:4-hydroxy-tetrahydrodipicolinate reductase|nr:4-hydroxy-tetrahydrodipicolinate reductase [Ilumatobacteraceae bacterium]
MIRVGVVGAAGRMGATVCAAVAADSALQLVAAIDTTGDATAQGVPINRELKALADAQVDVVVDFTVAAAARVTLPWLALHGVHAVVGTTGFSDADLATFKQQFTRSNCLIAPNFAIGAVLMMRFAELAAPFFDTAEIIEVHHDGKADSPSGTAVSTAARMAAASSEWAKDPTTHEAIAGARGAKGPADIRIHAVRMRGAVANQEVVLGTQGQTLTIRHDTIDRVSFMPGVVIACKKIAEYPGVTLGLDALLGI